MIKKIKGALKFSIRAPRYFVEGIRQSDEYKRAKRVIYEKIKQSYESATKMQFGTLTNRTVDLAKSNVRAAISIARSEGIFGLFKPRILIALITTSVFNIVPIMFAVLCFALVTHVLCYTMVIPIYGTYTFAATTAFIVDLPLSIANAILFGINAIYQAIYAGIAFLYNGFVKACLGPIVDGVNAVIGAINWIVGLIKSLVEKIPFLDETIEFEAIPYLKVPTLNMSITTAPPIVFAYFTPPDDIKYTVTGDVDILHFFNFVMIKPGPAYTDTYNIYYIPKLGFFSYKQGMVVKIPRINPAMKTNSFLTEPARGETIIFPAPDVTPIIKGFDISFSGTITKIVNNTKKLINNFKEDPGSTLLTGKTVPQLKEEDPYGDADHDGVPNKNDVNPINPYEKRDSDNDGISDRIDKDPTNPDIKEDKRNLLEQTADAIHYGLWCAGKMIVDAASMAAAPIISFFV